MLKKILLCLVALGTVSCGESQDSQTLTIAVSSELADLSPFGPLLISSTMIRHQVFDTLLTTDSNGELQPLLATDWWLVNPTNLHITIRSDVMFHNGDELTAEDVAYSLNRARVTSTLQANLTSIKNVEVVSPYEISIELNHPYLPILGVLSSSRAYIVNKRDFETGNNVVGSGPFKFKEWNQGQNVTIERFDDYWGEKAKVETIIIKTVPEALVRMIAAETGEVDIAYDIDYGEKERATNKLVFLETPISRIQYLGFNPNKKPFDNIKFRQAVAYALDIPGIIDIGVQGAGVQANNLTVRGAGYTNTEPLKQDIELARQLFKESDVVLDKPIRIMTVDGPRKSMSEIIQANMKEIGIDSEIELLEGSKFTQLAYDIDLTMGIIGWSGSFPDADFFYNIFFNSANIGPGGNFYGYSDPEMDRLLNTARAEQNYDRRQQLYAQVYEKTTEERVLIPLYYPIDTLVHRKNISGVIFNAYMLQQWNLIEKN